MNTTNMPPVLSEATSAMLAVVLLVMALGGAWSVIQTVRGCRSFNEAYDECRPVLALTMFFGALGARTVLVWWQRYAINHRVFSEVSYDGVMGVLLFTFSVAAAIGGMCWLRETLPNVMGFRGWILATCAAIGAGAASVMLN